MQKPSTSPLLASLLLVLAFVTVTLVVRPAMSLRLGVPSMAMRTGTRCVTLTQLPVAFCAGRTENSEPVPAPIEATWPLSVMSG